MTIEITGQEKYTFQDLVCAEMILRFHSFVDATFHVEPDGGEDGRIVFGTSKPGVTAEIQVKGENNRLTLDKLATWLAHFRPHKSDTPLLQQLIENQDLYLILIATGECSDSAAVYRAAKGIDWDGECHARGAVRQVDASDLLTAFGQVRLARSTDKDTPLNIRREERCRELVGTISAKETAKALHRLIIIDRVGQQDVQDRCERHLWRHGIPGDRAPVIIRDLRDAIIDLKKRGDAFPKAREIIAAAKPPAIRPACYIERGDEHDLIELLKDNNVLLLSGAPRVGKSDTACWIAAEFEHHGYSIHKAREVASTERFLLDTSNYPRLVVLDDPLSSINAMENAAELAKLQRLFKDIGNSRKLIVAQQRDMLLQICGVKEVSAVRTGTHCWHDLEQVPANFLQRGWLQFSTTYSVAPDLAATIEQAITAGEIAIGVGSLLYLAANAEELPLGASVEDFRRLATQEAAILGRALATGGYEQLLMSMAIASTAQYPVAKVELAFVAGEGGEGLPGKAEALGLIVMGGMGTPTEKPQYEREPRLSTQAEDSLEELERRTILKVGISNHVGFSHDHYRTAAEATVDGATQNNTNKIIRMVERGLFCNSPSTSQATARNLSWIHQVLARQPNARERILDLAAEALKRSFFPSTRDFCLRFLISKLQSMPDRAGQIGEWVQNATWGDLRDFEWVGGNARLPLGEFTGYRSSVGAQNGNSASAIAANIEYLESGSRLPPESVVSVLSYLGHKPEKLSLSIIQRLLSYEEAAIRAEAAKTWLGIPRTDDEHVLDRIFRDDHPRVARATLDGSAAGWEQMPEERRKRVLEGLVGMAASPVAAASLMESLILVGRHGRPGFLTAWPIFGTLMPVVMRSLPTQSAFTPARLFSSAMEATGALPREAIVALSDAWVGWLEREIANGAYPDDFSLGVADILIAGTRETPTLRAGLVKRLLSFPGTSAPLVFLADLVDEWNALTDEEQTEIERLVSTPRYDLRWLRAAVLTRTFVPERLQAAILGEGFRLDVGADQLVARLNPELLSAVIHLYAGQPIILAALGKHHSGKDVWAPVIERLSGQPAHPLFDLAWRELLFDPDDRQVAQCMMTLRADDAERVLNPLLFSTISNGPYRLPETWSAFLSLSPNETQHAAWIRRIAEAAPAAVGGLSQLRDWLPDTDLKAILVHFRNDLFVIKAVMKVQELMQINSSAEDRRALAQGVVKVLSEYPPLFIDTCDDVESILMALECATEFRSIVQESRKGAFSSHNRIRQALERTEPVIADWARP